MDLWIYIPHPVSVLKLGLDLLKPAAACCKQRGGSRMVLDLDLLGGVLPYFGAWSASVAALWLVFPLLPAGLIGVLKAEERAYWCCS